MIILIIGLEERPFSEVDIEWPEVNRSYSLCRIDRGSTPLLTKPILISWPLNAALDPVYFLSKQIPFHKPEPDNDDEESNDHRRRYFVTE